MASINKIILIGRLTADPELRYTPSGQPVANFALAVDRKFSKNDETDFIPIVAWRRLAEICKEYLHKGKLVAIEGRLQTRKYETPEGQKRTAFEVVADDMQMLDRGTGGGSGAGTSRDREPSSGRSYSPDPGGSDYGGGYPPADDSLGIDDIPF